MSVIDTPFCAGPTFTTRAAPEEGVLDAVAAGRQWLALLLRLAAVPPRDRI
jgi:hypothetical protein